MSLARIPIRMRVTLAFTAVMALVLVAVGLFLYLRLGQQLEESLDNGLKTRAGEVAALVRASDSGLSGSTEDSLIEAEESFAQVLTGAGQVRDSTPQLRGFAVLEAEDLARVADAPAFFERGGLPGVEGDARLLATSVETSEGELIVVVGASLDDRDEALSSLAAQLAIGGPIALLIASLAGYGAASAALRPVEAMRRRAGEISAAEPGERLPVGQAGDELSRLGATLNEMLARLEGTLERERRFVDDASHELRTPLALHKTELELALRYPLGEGELREAVASAIEEVDRLIQLAEDLLVVARTSDGELPLAREDVAVGDLFQTLAQRFRARAERSGRALVFRYPGELSVVGDRLRLEQAMTGTIDNALRHGDGEVTVEARSGDGIVALHVRDAGAGFDPDFRERAFERFTRADEARGRGGTGLGLAIVDTIARAHGGRAVARNRPDGGADVWIELPASA